MTTTARVDNQPIPFIDVSAQRRRLKKEIDAAVLRVLDHAQFIMGPEVRAVEADLAAFCGAKHALSCASGTDALMLVMMAKGVGPGDAVICPTFTFLRDGRGCGAGWRNAGVCRCRRGDIQYRSDKNCWGCRHRQEDGPQAQGDYPVDLFGLSADFDAINAAAKAEGMFVLDDAAQGFGATYKGRKVGTLSDVTATSFFPAKPLGCFGDGGAVFTDDDELIEVLRSVRVHGQGSDKYDNVRIGLTARLDTMQAAILIEKLKIFPDEIAARDVVAKRYNQLLKDVVKVPEVPAGHTSVWAQYTIRLPKGARDGFAAALKADGVPTAIYYPIPLHRQQAYKHYPVGEGGAGVSDRLADEVISLPMHAYIDAPTQERVADAVKRALKA